MLKVTRIVGCHDAEGNLTENTTKKLLCVLHFTDCTSGLLGASFAASDYALTAHLDALEGVEKPVKEGGTIDFQEWIKRANEKYVGTQESSAYGFTLPVSEFIPNALKIAMNGVEMSTRRVLGIGVNETTAKADAIAREKGRLNFALAKGKLEVVYAEDGGEDE